MAALFNDNSATKRCWAKNKSIIDEGIHTKVPVNMDRKQCKTKVKNSIEKRSSTIENVYNCGNDHQCDAIRKEIDALDYPAIEDPSDDRINLICAIDLVIEVPMNTSMITSHESMITSPNATPNNSMKERRNKYKNKRRRKLGLCDFSIPLWSSTCDEPSDSLLGEMASTTTTKAKSNAELINNRGRELRTNAKLLDH